VHQKNLKINKKFKKRNKKIRNKNKNLRNSQSVHQKHLFDGITMSATVASLGEVEARGLSVRLSRT